MSRVENDNNDNDNNNNNTLRFVAKRESSSLVRLLKKNSFQIRFIVRTQRETHKKRSVFVLSSSSFQQHFKFHQTKTEAKNEQTRRG